MPSPFPGMDPYLEGYLWPDVHHSLATQIRDQLAPAIRPRYVAWLEIQMVWDATGLEVAIMYPDVEVMERAEHRLGEPVPALTLDAPPLAPPRYFTPSTVLIPRPDIRVASVQIRDTAENELVTSIGILSPVNKREPGLTRYRLKRERLLEAGVHLLEIDLLRRGERPLTHPHIPPSPYLVALSRATEYHTHIWAVGWQTPLPVVPVPLRHPDPDAPLDLTEALHTVYERAAYDLSIDYHQPPPPPDLPPEAQALVADWLNRQD